MSFSFQHPYAISDEYAKPVAYFCMEFAIDQALKLYSGGLGFLAGSHLRSAYELKQNMVGVGILWKHGYYDQVRKSDQSMGVLFSEKQYSFLQHTDIKFTIRIAGNDVWVTAYYLPPEIFQTAPLFLLTTELKENDYLAKTTAHKLYDNTPEAKVAASILLGLGGARLFEFLNWKPALYHLNESHGLPLAFYLYNKYKNLDEIKKRLVFTNHTPEEAGNPRENFQLLEAMEFFDGVSIQEVRHITKTDDYQLNYTLCALRMSGIANGVSQMHTHTLSAMWKNYTDLCPVISITNAQNFHYWADREMYQALERKDLQAFRQLKKEAKRRLFKVVADQTGDLFDEKIFTIVFARRFAGYKRADLLLTDMARFDRMINNQHYPVQVIWAGKPYPSDYDAVNKFDRIVHICKGYPNCCVLTGYELTLSKLLKHGADAWLNFPRLSREASGTSGMTAAMNGAVNISMPDGWFPEFARDQINSFVIPPASQDIPEYERDTIEAGNLYDLMEKKVIPAFYEHPEDWHSLVSHSMKEVIPHFDSNRMADEYYKKLYNYHP